MKNYFLRIPTLQIASICFLTIFIAQQNKALSQNKSDIAPVFITWSADNQKISLKKATDEGVETPDSLEIQLYFDANSIDKNETDKINYEFKWYWLLSTRKQLMDISTTVLNTKKADNKGKLVIKSSRGNLKSGWWEVQVINKTTNEIVQLGKLNHFQIFLK